MQVMQAMRPVRVLVLIQSDVLAPRALWSALRRDVTQCNAWNLITRSDSIEFRTVRQESSGTYMLIVPYSVTSPLSSLLTTTVPALSIARSSQTQS